MSNTILFEVKNNIGIISLNRPEKFNSFNQEMALTLQKVLNECSENELLRCIYLTGIGKAFCAGQDLAELTQENPPTISEIVAKHYNPIILKIQQLNLPIVCAVNGVAAGAGANIALACDIVVSKESSSFIQAFSKIGLIPDSGGTYFLPRLIGMQKAKALMFLGDKINAKEAVELGMIYKCFNEEEFEKESFKIAETLAKMPTKGLVYTKQLLHQTYNNSLSEQLHQEDIFQQKAAATKDYAEGVQAFLEKRLPNFIGS